MRDLIQIILLLCIFEYSTNAQKVELVLPGKLSLSGTHESLHSVNPKKNHYNFTRANSDFSIAEVFSLQGRKSELPYTFRFLGDSLSYYSGLTPLPIFGHKAVFASNIQTRDLRYTDEWNLFTVDLGDRFDKKVIRAINSLNSQSSECCLVMNNDGDTYFASNREGSWDIFSAKYLKEKDEFTDITKVEGLSTAEDEWPSYISQKDNLIIFSSIRKTGFGGDDLYFSTKENGKWQPSQSFSNKINTSSYEDSGLLSSDGKWFYFSSRKTGDSDIYRIKAKKTLLKSYLKAKK